MWPLCAIVLSWCSESCETWMRFPLHHANRVCRALGQNKTSGSASKLNCELYSVSAISVEKVYQLCKHCGLHRMLWNVRHLVGAYFNHEDLLWDILGLTTVKHMIYQLMLGGYRWNSRMLVIWQVKAVVALLNMKKYGYLSIDVVLMKKC